VWKEKLDPPSKPRMDDHFIGGKPQSTTTAVRKKIEPLPLQDKDPFSRFIDGIKIPMNRYKN